MRKNLLKPMLCALLALFGVSTWAQTTTLLEYGTSNVAWSESNLSEWTAGGNPTIVDNYVEITGGNGSYATSQTITPTENAIINVEAVWRGRSNTGRTFAQGNGSYFRFGNIIVAQNDQDKKHGYGFAGLGNISGVTTFTAGSYRIDITNCTWLLIQMEINTASNTVTSFSIKSEDGATTYASATDVALADADYTTVAFGYHKSGSVSTANAEDLKSVKITQTLQTVETANYTVKYVCNGQKVKESETRTGVVGQSITLNAADTQNFYAADNSMKYIYVSSDVEGQYVYEGAVVTVTFREAEKFSWTARSSVGNYSISGEVFEGDKAAAKYPIYQLVDGILWTKATAGNASYVVSFDVTENNTEYVIDYTNTEIPAIFYTEMEDIEGMSVYAEGNAEARSSQRAVGYSVGGNTAITTLPMGKYKLVASFYSPTSAGGKYNFFAGNRNIWSFTSGNANATLGNTEIVLAKETAIALGECSNTQAVDYIYIQSLGEPTPEELAEAQAEDQEADAAAEAAAALQAAKDALQDVINEASSIETADKEGVDELSAAITAAQEALNAEDATVESLTAAKEALEAAIAAFEEANKPIDPATAIVNPGFEDSEAVTADVNTSGSAQGVDYEATGWKLMGSAAWSNSAIFAYSGEAKLNKVKTPATDAAGNAGNALGITTGWGGAVTYQSANAFILPADTYTLVAEVFNGNAVQQLTSKLGFVPTNGNAIVSTTTSYTSNRWTVDYVTFTLDAPTEGKIQLGGQAVSGGSNSNAIIFIDNIALTDEAGLAEIQNKVDNANAQLDAAEAQAAFEAAKAEYDNLKAGMANLTFPYASAEKKAAAEAALESEPSNIDEIAAMSAALKQAYRQYAESSALLEGVEGAMDVTSKIVNPNAEQNIAEPWVVTLGEGSGGALDVKSNESMTDGDGKNNYKYFDGGNWGANSWDVSLTQAVTLPKGKYLLSVSSRASVDLTSFNLFAGEEKIEMTKIGASGGLFDRGWNDASLEFELEEEATVNLGVQGVANSNQQWMSFTRFRLAQFPFDAAYGTIWDGNFVCEDVSNYENFPLSTAFFKDFAQVGDTLRVSVTNAGAEYQDEARADVRMREFLYYGALRVFANNQEDLIYESGNTIQGDDLTIDIVIDEAKQALLSEGENIYVAGRNLTITKVELLEGIEVDELLAEAMELAAEDGVAVGKLLAAIDAYNENPDTEALTAAMNQYKADNADQEKDETAKVATDGWKKFETNDAAGVCATQFAPAITTYDGRTAQLAEVYETTAETTGQIIYQDITGLQNGSYKVGFYGNAFFTAGRGFDSDMADGAEDVAYVFANDQQAFITAHIATSTTENDFRQFDVEVTTGTIKLGMGKAKAGTNWHTMQIYQLTWFTTAKEVYAQDQAKLQSLIAKAESLLNDENKTEGKDVFNVIVEGAKQAVGSNMLNIAELEAIIGNLETAIDQFVKGNYFIDFATGAYYIIDAESGLMMAAGNNYGTRGIVNEAGLDLTLTPNTDTRTVTIDSRVSNGGDNHFLGINLYMDSAPFGWALEYQGFGFYITDGSKYINVDYSNNLVLSDTPREFIIVTAEGVMEERMSTLEEATAENPVDATFLLQNPNFNRNDQRVAAWVVSDDCTNVNLNGGNQVNNCAESYHSAFTISQTVEGAPAGIYTLTAQGFYRQDDGAEEDAPVFFGNDQTAEVPVKTGEENSMSAASESFTNGLYSIEPITFTGGEDGVLTVGVKGTAVSQWVIFDNFRLTYKGVDPLASLKSQLAELIAECEALDESQYKADSWAAMIEALNAAKAALEAADATEASLTAAYNALFEAKAALVATGIYELSVEGKLNGTVYNVKGQKVENPTKGLYIVNGKKTVVK